MAAFDPPPGDGSALAAAATTLGTVSGELVSDLSSSTSAVQTAVASWRGTRQQDFTQAGAGVQVQLKVAGDGCSTVATLLGQYARTFAQTCSDVAEYKRRADAAQLEAAANNAHLKPDSLGHETQQLAAGAKRVYYEMLAVTAKSGLATLAGKIAAEIDAQTDRVAPVSSALSPAQIRRQVSDSLGLAGLNGATAARVPASQGWALLAGAQHAIPAGAVLPDGTVDWTKAFALPVVPKPGTSPNDVSTWWTSLSPTEQDGLLNHDPQAVGNLDGIPVVDRDFANRVALPQLIARVEAQLAAMPGEPERPPPWPVTVPIWAAQSEAWTRWKEQHDTLQAQLAGLQDVAQVLQDGAANQSPLFLIGVQNIGNGRAIISQGNPDTAAYVATYVPGMGTKLTGIQGGVARSQTMYRSAQLAGATSVAAVTWYGYAAPQSLGPAASEDDATQAAPLLDSFQDGLRVTHQGAPSYNTVIAHSYGTTVTGMAASHGHTLNVDNVIFVASPGVTVDHVDDLHLTGISAAQDNQHVYATVAEYDPIRLASGINGGDPNLSDFGAHEFHSDADRGHLWLLGWNSSAHSSYWNQGNPALRSIGQIIAGQGGQVK